jgi:phage-related protein
MFFEIEFLNEAVEFLEKIPAAAQRKLLRSIEIAQHTKDPKFFKKVNHEIWEFRARVSNNQYRLMAFWDKKSETLVICTHGFIKKTQKIPKAEISKAEKHKIEYYKK